MQNFGSLLITGGTGSFGRAFVKHLLLTSRIERICVYSRNEHTQAEMREQLGNNPRLRFLIGDVRDIDRLRRAMRGCEAVVHAAALKRIEVGAYNPDEMVKTNILGAMNVIEASVAMHVRRVVYLSTDKAFQPISPYGQSKALAESLMLAANNMHGRKGPDFLVTRYGNVWNSCGSVAPRWKTAKEKGLPVSVTDLDCTRFFMTMREAVDLVGQALFYEEDSNLLIPDWLPAYRLGDLWSAFNFEESAKLIGLPQFEKLHESMSDTLCSADARRMTVEELRGYVDEI